MSKRRLLLGLLAVGLLIACQIGSGLVMQAAPAAYVIGPIALGSGGVAAGELATINAEVRSRTGAGVVTVEAVVRDRRGQVAWMARWPDQTFTPDQTRAVRGRWAVPMSQPPGEYALTIRVVGQDVAAPGVDVDVARPRSIRVPLGSAAGTAPAADALAPTTATPPGLAGDAVQRRARAELKIFTDWLAANGVHGYIGEFGWPDDIAGDQASWDAVADAWLADADAAGLWATAWATGEWWHDSYNLGVYEASRAEGVVDRANTQAAMLEAHPSGPRHQRGVNVAGAEFGGPSGATSAFSNTNPGRYGEQYHYDRQETFDFLASRGVTIIRLPFRWERLQRTPGGSLDAAELRRLKEAVARAGAAGLGVILDVHNGGAYYLSDGSQGVRRAIGSPQITRSHFADLWRRLSLAFNDDPNIIAYDLMNEPVDLPATHAPGATLDNWEGAVQRWSMEAAGPAALERVTAIRHSGAGALKATRAMAASGFGQMRLRDGAGDRVRDLTAGGPSFGVWVYLPPGTPGDGWAANLFLYDAQWANASAGSVPLVAGQWTLVTGTFPSDTLRSVRVIGVQVYAYTVNATVSVYLDDLTQGRGLSPAQTWEAAAQAALDAIRATGDRKLVMVPGYHWSGAQWWTTYHPRAWIRDGADNVRYTAHHYWDADHGGVYPNRYADELARAARQP